MTDPSQITRSDAGCIWAAVVIALAIVGLGFVVLCWMTGPGRAEPGQPGAEADPAPPQPACFPPMKAMELARQQFGELPVFSGSDRSGSRFVMTLNPESKSWSIFACSDAACCVIGTGGGAIFPKGA